MVGHNLPFAVLPETMLHWAWRWSVFVSCPVFGTLSQWDERVTIHCVIVLVAPPSIQAAISVPTTTYAHCVFLLSPPAHTHTPAAFL